MYQLLAQGIHSPGAAKLFADTDNTMISDSTSISPYRIVSMLCLYCIWLTNYENKPLLPLHSILWNPAFSVFTLYMINLF